MLCWHVGARVHFGIGGACVEAEGVGEISLCLATLWLGMIGRGMLGVEERGRLGEVDQIDGFRTERLRDWTFSFRPQPHFVWGSGRWNLGIVSRIICQVW